MKRIGNVYPTMQSVSNCEVGWCGGLLKGYSENNAGVFEPEAAGGALQVSSTGVSVTDSYIHHCGPFALIVAIHNNAENPASCILHFEDICIANKGILISTLNSENECYEIVKKEIYKLLNSNKKRRTS